MKTFTVKEEHLKLLQKMYVDWDACEFGAPRIDCKRPYGNSQVFEDIAEILNIEPALVKYEEKYFSEEQEELMKQLHSETQVALQIVLRMGKFETGIFEADDYSRNWRRIK